MPRLSSRRGGECPWKCALFLSLGCLSLPKTLSKLTRGLRRNQDIIAA
jgi:hypothetical protein